MDLVAEGYETNAVEYLRVREKSPIGTVIVEQWCGTLSEKATVVELACGGGYPVTRTLSNAGLQLWAVDSSPTLIQTFQSRFPNIPVQCCTVQEFDFFSRTVDAAIAWGIVFLLSESDQVKLLSRVYEMLNPRGRFLFTAPIQTAWWEDRTTSANSCSLGRERYTELLNKTGFEVVSTFTDEGENNYYDAHRA